jgi:hypothetical protein
VICPKCGLVAGKEQIQKFEVEKNKSELTPNINPVNTRPIIMQSSKKGRRNKKLYHDLGNEINQQDADIIKDVAQGRHVKSYKETVLPNSSNSK